MRRLLGGGEKNWPIAEWHVPNTDPRSLYLTQFPSHIHDHPSETLFSQ